MYGREQAGNKLYSRQRRIATAIFGVVHIGNRSRFWRNVRASKELLKQDKLDILEVGSECGALVFWLAKKNPTHQVTGLEIDADMVRQCETINGKIGSDNAQFVCSDAQEPFKFSKRFDVIFSTHALEHMEDDSKALRNIHDALKENGTLVLQVPQGDSHTLSDHEIEMGHHRAYTEAGLQELMEEIGFKAVEVGRCTGKIGDYAVKLNKILAMIGGPVAINGIFIPLTLLMGYLDSLITKNPRYGGLLAIGKRGYPL